MTELHQYLLEDDRAVECGDCQWHGAAADLDPIADAQERLYPGEIVPAGQCPSCGTLAYLVEEPAFTVLLLRPDWQQDGHQSDWVNRRVVTAPGWQEAERLARQAAASEYETDADDFATLAVFEGHQRDQFDPTPSPQP